MSRLPAVFSANGITSEATLVELPAAEREVAAVEQDDSLFERFPWFYILCRERLFRDDTQRIIKVLWPEGRPEPGTKLIELGCGPGFYSCRLAARFRDLSVVGADRSRRQLICAQEKAGALGLDNCRFERGNVLQLSCADATFDVLIASRLFTVLPDCARAIAEMYRVLRPGGRCFIAEPRHAFWASIPLFAMRFLAGAAGLTNGYREPSKATVFDGGAFHQLFVSQPWREVKVWRDGRYQYAVCEKG